VALFDHILRENIQIRQQAKQSSGHSTKIKGKVAFPITFSASTTHPEVLRRANTAPPFSIRGFPPAISSCPVMPLVRLTRLMLSFAMSPFPLVPCSSPQFHLPLRGVMLSAVAR
jgi:hypothetical protein